MKRIVILLFVLIHIVLQAQPPVPPLWDHRVHDEAHILSTAAIDQLEIMLKQHEDSTSNQIGVLIISSLDGAVLEDYSLHVAHDVWKLGQKNKDNGILLLIAVDDRKMRIEVGKGLEGAVPDVIASRIIRNEIAPAFRDQDYDRGLVNGVTAVIQAIGGEYVDDAADTSSSGGLASWQERVIMGIFVFFCLGVFTLLGLLTQGCVGWFLYAFLVPFYATFPMVIFGTTGGLITLGIYAVGFPILRKLISNTSAVKKFNSGSSSRGGSNSGSSWSSGGSSWSSSRSSSSSSSGGGGSFGGGGSSGSW